MPTLTPRAPAAPPQPAAELARLLGDFLLEHPHAAVLEEGRILFDLREARSSLSSERGRCLWHLWSGEQNLVRTVIAIRVRKDSLRIETTRLGQSVPQFFELVPHRDRRPPTTRKLGRERFLRIFGRMLQQAFPDFAIDTLTTAPDLEHSFGPGHARGLHRRGQAAWAVVAVSAEEPPSTIEATLTTGLLWLAHCRARGQGRAVVAGLRLFLPRGQAAVARSRLAWLNLRVASFELYEVDPLCEGCELVPPAEEGVEAPRLMHAFDPASALERCRVGVDRLLSLLPQGLRADTEVRANSPAEVSFALHGLEFARIRQAFAAHSFSMADEITFGSGMHETPLTSETEALFDELTGKLWRHRSAGGDRRNPLYRLQPERWLESVLRRNLEEVDAGLCTGPIYTQVAAAGMADRGLLDLLAITRSGRLAILEVKADDDLHLPLQALDYWMRIRALQRQGALATHGYFRGMEISDAAPLLYLVAPVLRIHPAMDTVLAYLSPKIPWQIVGVGEDWRARLRGIMRKRGPGWR